MPPERCDKHGNVDCYSCLLVEVERLWKERSELATDKFRLESRIAKLEAENKNLCDQLDVANRCCRDLEATLTSQRPPNL